MKRLIFAAILLGALCCQIGCATAPVTERKTEKLPNGTTIEKEERLPWWVQIADGLASIFRGGYTE
jgi:hypothetical protein